MELLTWIDKKVSEIKETVLFGKYFDTILIEEGIGDAYLFNPSRGIDIILREDTSVRAIHFHSGKIDGANQFEDALPLNIKFFQTRSEMRGIFGRPNESGGGEKSFLYEKTKDWDKYFFDEFSLHLQFADIDCSIDLVTIISPKE